MRQVFADTGYWIALVNPRDQIHTKAVSVTQELSPVRILTSEMVLAEVLNSFSDAGPLRQAVGSVVQKLRSNRDVIIVPQTSEQFESALRRYKQAADKKGERRAMDKAEGGGRRGGGEVGGKRGEGGGGNFQWRVG